MEDEEGYTILNLRPKWGCSGGLSSPGNPGSRQCPGWLQVALGAGNLILAVTVLLLAVCDCVPLGLLRSSLESVAMGQNRLWGRPRVSAWLGAGAFTGNSHNIDRAPHSHRRCFAVSHLVSEKGQIPAAPGSDGARSRDIATPRGSDGAGSRDTATPRGSDRAGSRDPSTAECSTCLERFRSQLCPPAPPGPAGGSGCKLCPTDWRLRGDKCYWVSRGRKTWRESRADCSARGSQLLVIRDPEELEFLKALTQDSNQFWVGLSISSPEKAWTWLDGSRLNQTQFPVSGWDDWNRCGKLWGNWIQSDTCSSVRQWICQRDAVPL
ncbi:uncharacterized protein LOC120392392 isoform X2 [Mauremys reevesii]|uniref:uncharacterized protein LOC120392392 isoform X2 n=1 Tax=Mauremys reevesii TaxID=260615 RepID=UPI00193F3469|nr:uncharacterized protein LOC120392392 isoform X2 [Mauremys reevesii]